MCFREMPDHAGDQVVGDGLSHQQVLMEEGSGEHRGGVGEVEADCQLPGPLAPSSTSLSARPSWR